MLDSQLAALYGVKPIRLREQVCRNQDRISNGYDLTRFWNCRFLYNRHMRNVSGFILLPALAVALGGCAAGGMLVTGSSGVASSSDPTKLSVCVFPATGARGSGFERDLMKSFYHYASRGGSAWNADAGALFRSVESVLSLDDSRNCDISVKITHPGMTIMKPAIVDVYSSRTKESLLHFEVAEANRGQDLASPVHNAFAKGSRPYKTVMAQRSESDRPAEFAAAAAVAAPARLAPSDVETPSYSMPEREHDLAVVMGIDGYSDLPRAPYAERDAAAFAAHARAMGVPARNVVLLTGSKAGRAAIEKYVEQWLPRLVVPDSRVYFFFSGHGAPDIKSGQAYLVPWDGDPNFLETTAYPVKRLYQRLRALKAKEVLVAMDTCFSGAGGRSVLASGARPLVTAVDAGGVETGVTVLTASASSEISGSLDDKGHGAFTYFLLKGLNGGSKDFTADGLARYLTPLVQGEARRLNRDQTPQLLGDGDVRFR